MLSNRRKFQLGLLGIISFMAMLIVWLSPVAPGHLTGLQWADQFFNGLTKASAYQFPKVFKESENFVGKPFVLNYKAANESDAKMLERLYTSFGAKVDAQGTSLTISGDLGKVSQGILSYSEDFFNNRRKDMTNVLGFDSKDGLYAIYLSQKALEKYYLRNNQAAELKFVREILERAIEPAYNFDGIVAAGSPKPVEGEYAIGALRHYPSIEQSPIGVREMIILTGLIIFYLLYTCWYGFSLMYLLEGAGISKLSKKARKEA
ncbi:hypothetical protein TDSAC_1528 [Thermodesulfobium acidiphilum]|uniref:Uncharacterized protein n=1 Tax=Thermodesulfobium acidiphilum TaxID=1794699 RepID=A0A2R4W230_THEAF|nr:hypothetical protein [Thermodesulfobium acidiphilum]AWB10867.1 hypothetical protein TDSAC_1528 [Thermodesulfobium acidiphilum]